MNNQRQLLDKIKSERLMKQFRQVGGSLVFFVLIAFVFVRDAIDYRLFTLFSLRRLVKFFAYEGLYTFILLMSFLSVAAFAYALYVAIKETNALEKSINDLSDEEANELLEYANSSWKNNTSIVIQNGFCLIRKPNFYFFKEGDIYWIDQNKVGVIFYTRFGKIVIQNVSQEILNDVRSQIASDALFTDINAISNKQRKAFVKKIHKNLLLEDENYRTLVATSEYVKSKYVEMDENDTKQDKKSQSHYNEKQLKRVKNSILMILNRNRQNIPSIIGVAVVFFLALIVIFLSIELSGIFALLGIFILIIGFIIALQKYNKIKNATIDYFEGISEKDIFDISNSLITIPNEYMMNQEYLPISFYNTCFLVRTKKGAHLIAYDTLKEVLYDEGGKKGYRAYFLYRNRVGNVVLSYKYSLDEIKQLILEKNMSVRFHPTSDYSKAELKQYLKDYQKNK